MPAAEAGQGPRNLLIRVAAALVLAPLAIAGAYFGSWWWIVLVTAAAIGLLVEWLTVVGAVRPLGAVAAGVVALVVSAVCLGFVRPDLALVALILGLAAVALLSPPPGRWAAAGFLYAGAAQMASVLVRLDASMGFVALVFVMLIVWVTDIGGYFAGRGIGGAKLWPRVSPNKTWAGAFGGFGASLVVAAGFAALQLGKAGPLLLLAAALSVVAQLGDLLEFGGQTAVRGEGFQPHHPRPWRPDGSPRRLRRRDGAGFDFRTFAGRRGWRRPRSYGLVKQ